MKTKTVQFSPEEKADYKERFGLEVQEVAMSDDADWDNYETLLCPPIE